MRAARNMALVVACGCLPFACSEPAAITPGPRSDARIVPTGDAPGVPNPIDDPCVTVLENDGGVPADLSCLGRDRTPPPGTDVAKDIELTAFGTGGEERLPEQTVDVFRRNNFVGTPDVTVKSDVMAMLGIVVRDGQRIGYHVRAAASLADFYALDDLHTAAAPGKKIRWLGFTLERQEFFSLALTGDKMWADSPGHGTVIGRVVDCQRRPMQFADVVVEDVTDAAWPKRLSFAKCGMGLCRTYLTDTELPDYGRSFTSRSGLFVMLEVPVERRLRVIALCRRPEGKMEEVAWRDLVVNERAVTSQYLEPNNPR